MTVLQQTNDKPIPKSILIFGASDHIGGPLAAMLANEAPSIKLRLATSKQEKVAALAEKFPTAEVIVADYNDQASMDAAVAGMEGIFGIFPNAFAEEKPAHILVDAIRKSGTLIHMLRVVGLQPEASQRRIPAALQASRMGIEIQHPIAKRIYDEADLPVTYLNCGATFMDNFIRLGLGMTVMKQRKLIWPERMVPWIDPREVAEVAARLFLSDNHRHIGQFHTLNNGHDHIRFHEVAEMLTEVLGEPVAYDSSPEAFRETYAMMGEHQLNHLLAFFQYEQDNEVVWALNNFVERTIGRKPKTVKQWLTEHREMLLGKEPALAH